MLFAVLRCWVTMHADGDYVAVGSPYLVKVAGEMIANGTDLSVDEHQQIQTCELSHIGRDCQLTLKLPGIATILLHLSCRKLALNLLKTCLRPGLQHVFSRLQTSRRQVRDKSLSQTCWRHDRSILTCRDRSGRSPTCL